MRFMLCAKDRATGALRLLSDESYASRRAAVGALSGLPDLAALLGSDVYLVDLDAAVPVALVQCGSGESAPGPKVDVPEVTGMAEATTTIPEGATETDGASAPGDAAEPEDELPDWATPEPGAPLGIVQIDIDAWTCEDCIYVTTCAFAGTRRPVTCGSFQWRA